MNVIEFTKPNIYMCNFILDCIEGIDGVPCYGYGVIRDGEVVAIPYPINKDNGKQEQGKSFHHGRFINSLRESAKNAKK